MANGRKVKISRVLFRDYVSYILLIMSVTCLVLIVTSPLTLLFGFFLVRRVLMIKRVVEHGDLAEGTIVGLRFLRARWKISYVYQANGTNYQASHTIVAFKSPLELSEKTAVAYDPHNPQNPCLVTLYAD